MEPNYKALSKKEQELLNEAFRDLPESKKEKRRKYLGIPVFQYNFKYFGIGWDALCVWEIGIIDRYLFIEFGHLFLRIGKEERVEPWMM